MGKLIFIFLAFLSMICHAQIPGKRTPGPYVLSNGISFKEGDTIILGTGSDPTGDFKFIYNPPNYLLGAKQQSLSKQYSNAHLVIKRFNTYTNKKVGSKVWAVVNPGGILNGVIELQQAYDAGEIIVKGKPPISKNAISAASSSVADELIKLKTLLDAGAITKPEYEAQKKKLLN